MDGDDEPAAWREGALDRIAALHGLETEQNAIDLAIRYHENFPPGHPRAYSKLCTDYQAHLMGLVEKASAGELPPIDALDRAFPNSYISEGWDGDIVWVRDYYQGYARERLRTIDAAYLDAAQDMTRESAERRGWNWSEAGGAVSSLDDLLIDLITYSPRFSREDIHKDPTLDALLGPTETD